MRQYFGTLVHSLDHHELGYCTRSVGEPTVPDVSEDLTFKIKTVKPLATLAFFGSVLFFTGIGAADENWPQWRGPGANGVAPGDNYPVKWTTAENVVWRFKLPGLGASTPALWQDNILLTGENGGSNSVLCLDRAGNKRWEVMLGKETRARNRKASGSNSSPVTDGRFIYVYFKSGDLSCLSFDGNVVWRKNLQQLYGEDTLWWDLGTSPVLTKDLVVVACMQSGGSYLVGFEKQSGKIAWKQDRNLDAPGESAQSYTTPLVIQSGESEVIIVLGADHVTAHDAKTGDQIWIVGGLNPNGRRNWRSIASPVIADGSLIAPYARGGSLTAIRLGGSGDVTKTHTAWSNGGPAADVPSPVSAGGKVFLCTDRGTVTMFNSKTGSTLATAQVPAGRNTFSASPVLAGQHLYVTNEQGTTFVFHVADNLKLVAENKLEDFTVATPIFSDGRAYVRTDSYLWCIGDK